MQDQDWTIEQVSQEPPREWNNPMGGVIYYKKVKLAGHPKAVSVGKKTPDALQPGGHLYGHIEVDMSGKEDKFKAGQKQGAFGGGSSFTAASSPKPAYKDNSDGMRQGMCFNNAAQYLNTLNKNTALSYQAWADEVYNYANALYLKGDLGATATPTPAPTGNPAKLKQGDPVWPSDKSDGEAQSLYNSVAQSEDINLDDIPF